MTVVSGSAKPPQTTGSKLTVTTGQFTILQLEQLRHPGRRNHHVHPALSPFHRLQRHRRRKSVADLGQPQRQWHGHPRQCLWLFLRPQFQNQHRRQLHRHHRAHSARLRRGRRLAVHRHAPAQKHRQLRTDRGRQRPLAVPDRRANQNSGGLNAPGGDVRLCAGEKVMLSERPDGRGLSAGVLLPSGSMDNLDTSSPTPAPLPCRPRWSTRTASSRQTLSATKTASSNWSPPTPSPSARTPSCPRTATTPLRATAGRSLSTPAARIQMPPAHPFPWRAAPRRQWRHGGDFRAGHHGHPLRHRWPRRVRQPRRQACA